MIWALIEIVLPMLLTFLFGLLVGWVLWRRYRYSGSNVSDDASDGERQLIEFSGTGHMAGDPQSSDTLSSGEIDRDDQQSASAVVAAGQASSGELSLAGNSRSMYEQVLAKELNAANASIRSLVAELDVTRTRLQSSESRLLESGQEVTDVEGSASTSRSIAGNDSTGKDDAVQDHALGNDASEDDASEDDALEDGALGDAALQDAKAPAAADTSQCAVCNATRELLSQLQQKYQVLETSQSIDKAELAKKHHLESRLSDLTRELSDSKIELLDAKKTASRLQAEVAQLTAQVSAAHKDVESHASRSESDDPHTEIVQLQSRLAEMTPAAQQVKDYQSQVAALQARLQQSEARVRQIEQSDQRIDQLDSQLQSRLADELEKSQQQIQDLQLKASQSNSKAAELVRMRSRIATLESELGDANSRAEDSEKLQRRVADLESMLKGSQVKIVNERLVETEAQLRIANNRLAEQQRQLNRLQTHERGPDEARVSPAKAATARSEPPESVQGRRQRGTSTGGVLAGDEVDNECSAIGSKSDSNRKPDGKTDRKPAGKPTGNLNSDAIRISRLAATIDSHRQEDKDDDRDAGGSGRLSAELTTENNDYSIREDTDSENASNEKTGDFAAPKLVKEAADPPQWQAGVTRFGTPAARHKDDLKVIRGIGPVLESTLNEAEIQTWEQLAALSADEIQLIEKSIDFPGRMSRERWVEQATELVDRYPDTEDRPSGKNLSPKKA